MYKNFFKRLLDILLSIMGIIILAVPMLIIACIIKMDSKGPAIFKTERVGKDNKPFKFYKFRTMKTTAPKDCAPMYLKSEDYITKTGKFLRKTSLDELPQLYCIFIGSMSIIGPRPCGFSETDLMAERDKTGASKIRPGLTGFAQVNGRDILASNIVKKAEYDGKYAQKITFLGDMKIFFKTIAKVFVHEGVVEGEKVLTQHTIQAVQLAQPELAATTTPTTKAAATATLTTNETTTATTNTTTIATVVPVDNIIELENKLRDDQSTQNTAHTA